MKIYLNKNYLEISIQFFECNPSVNQIIDNNKNSIMKLIASQNFGSALPLNFQLSRKYRIGFCGD